MKDLFPFPEIRKGQDRFYQDTRDALSQGGIVFAHAPTGIGKTAAALAAALEIAVEQGRKVLFMTPRQSQHRIAIETLRHIQDRHQRNFVVADIISKQAMCPQDIAQEYHAVFGMLCSLQVKSNACPYYRTDENLNAYLAGSLHHVEEIKEIAAKEQVCPHRAAMEVAADANVIVCDYNYIFSDASDGILERLGVGLSDVIMVVDEAHNLPGRIRDHLSGTLTMYNLREASRILQSHDKVLYSHLVRIGDYLNDELSKVDEGKEITVDKAFLVKGINRTLAETLDQKMPLFDFLKKLRVIGEIEIQQNQTHTLMSIAEFFQGWLSASATARVLTRKETASLKYQLLDPSIMSERILKETHSAIFMSGTLYPTTMYADILGAHETGKTVLCREYPSPFPPENRKVIVSTSVTTKYTERSEEMFKFMGEQISDVINSVYENSAVFFPSYQLLEQVWDQFPVNPMWRIFKEQRGMTKEQRNALFTQMTRDHGQYRAMLWGVQAGSLSEGMDYSGNSLKTIIVVGLPLVPPSLFTDQLIGYYSRKFGRDRGKMYAYVYPAMNKVHQAAGRGIRSETDMGIIILMDKRFREQTYRQCFPPEFNIIFTDAPAEPCKGFFRSGGKGSIQ